MSVPQPLSSRLIGALFVERGLVSESQIRIALEIQVESGQQLGQILVERFGVSRKELASVVAEQWAKLGGSAGPEDTASWRRLGEIFVDRGFVTEEELEQALVRQRQTGERLGEALVAQGVISKFELAGALAEQMAALERSAAEDATDVPAEATVHQLPTRPEEPSETAPSLELVPSEQNGSGPAETVDAPGEASGLVAVEDPEPEELELPEEPQPEVVALDGPVHDADEPAAEATVVDEPALELVVVAEQTVDAVEIEEQAVSAVQIEVPAVDAVEDDETAFDDVAIEEPAVDDVAVPAPAVACVAFAPTTKGYRLVQLDAVPAPGETIDVPDVGVRLVLRVGRSPYPLDDRICAFVEEPVVWAFAFDAVH
jgi:hypothetical protein